MTSMTNEAIQVNRNGGVGQVTNCSEAGDIHIEKDNPSSQGRQSWKADIKKAEEVQDDRAEKKMTAKWEEQDDGVMEEQKAIGREGMKSW